MKKAKTEKWCCDGLKWSFAERHERGILVYAEPPRPELGMGATFYLGFRSVAKNFADEIPYMSFPLTINARTGMKFCPWCGVELKQFYKAHYSQFIDKEMSAEFSF